MRLLVYGVLIRKLAQVEKTGRKPIASLQAFLQAVPGAASPVALSHRRLLSQAITPAVCM